MTEGELKDASDTSRILKGEFVKILEEMLEAELDEEVGYTKYNYKNKDTSNSRNGHRDIMTELRYYLNLPYSLKID